MDTNDKFEILSVFGYIPGALSVETLSRSNSKTNLNNFETLGARDKTEIVTQLTNYRQEEPVEATLNKILDDVKTAESKLKLEWIHCGILRPLISNICKNNEAHVSEKILKNLATSNTKGCSLIAEAFLGHINTHFQCVGSFSAMSNLVQVPSFQQFLKEGMGVPLLIDFYEKASIVLHQSKLVERRLGDLDYKPDLLTHKLESRKTNSSSRNVSPRNVAESGNLSGRNSVQIMDRDNKSLPDAVEQDSSKDKKSSGDSLLRKQHARVPSISSSPSMEPKKLETTGSSGTGLGLLGVPSLALSLSNASTPTLNAPGSGRNRVPTIDLLNTGNRGEDYQISSRRRTGNISPKRDEVMDTVTTKLFASKKDSNQELQELGKQLGRTFMASDLTALLSLKNASVLAREGHKSKRLTKNQVKVDGGRVVDENVREFRNQPCYIIKTHILKMLQELTKPSLSPLPFKSPVNLLFTELLISFEDSLLMNDKGFRSNIYNILSNFATDVELRHTKSWLALTSGLTVTRKENYRKKMDALLWRVKNRLDALISSNSKKNLGVYLSILHEYISSCSTRVMSANVVDVCLEQMLKIQHIIFSLKISDDLLEIIPIVHRLLCIYDEIAAINTFAPLDNLLLDIFLTEDSLAFINKDFCYHVIKNPEAQKIILGCESEKGKLLEYRSRLFKHFSVILSFFSSFFSLFSHFL